MKLGCKLVFILLGIFAISAAQAAETFCYHFYGVKGELLTNIQARLQLNQTQCINHISANEIISLFNKSKKTIAEAIQPYGYFRPSIRGRLIHTNIGWIANFTIVPGKPLRITTINIHVSGHGRHNCVIRNAERSIPLKVGDIFNASTYDTAKNKLFHVARNQGYIKAFYNNEILIDLKQYTCRLSIKLNTGDQYFFGPVTFEGDAYSNAFLSRFIHFNSSQPFSSKTLLDLQQAMEHSYYFKQVIITPDFTHTNNRRVPVHFAFTLANAKEYSLGMGYGTLTGPRLTAGLSLRRLTDTGVHFEGQMKLSSVLSSVSTNFYIPGKDPLTETYLIGANAKKFRPNAGNSASITLTGGYLLDQTRTRESMTLNFLVDRFNIYPSPNSRKSHLLYPDFKFIYFYTDNLINPRDGVSFTFDVKGAAQAVLSTTSFIQPQVNAKVMYSPFSFSRIIGRGALGYTAVHDLYKFPLSQRFFAGGINSIRGFADSSIGPGRYLEVGSIEYQNKVYGELFAAIFYDVGTASNHFHKRMNRGTGVGVVYNTIIGPIKFYLARAISKRTRPYSVEFSVGPEFA